MTHISYNQVHHSSCQKVTFLGDILFELDFFRKISREGKSFQHIFAPLAPLLAQSDFVVANLETPIAGPEAGYTSRYYSFNTPPELLDVLRDLPIHMLTTANNHCLDRGLTGLLHTLDALDKKALCHTGTFRDESEFLRPCLVHLGNTTIAFESCTASINKLPLRKYGSKLQPFHVSTLADPFLMAHFSESSIPFYRLRCFLGDCFSPHWTLQLKRWLGLHPQPWSDSERPETVYLCQLERFRQRLERDQRDADLTIILPHIGGQFNSIPGAFSEILCKKILSLGANAVIASHAHTIQPVEFLLAETHLPCHNHSEGAYGVCAYSLGNVTFSAKSPTAVPSSFPEFGLAFHMYLQGGKIDHMSYSILKFDDASGATWPVDVLAERLSVPEKANLANQVSLLVQRVRSRLPAGFSDAGQPEPFIQEEYSFP